MVISQIANHNDTSAVNGVTDSSPPNERAPRDFASRHTSEERYEVTQEDLGRDGDITMQPPSKKRKFLDSASKARTQPRGQSPPWRLPIAQGPSSFTIDGRRKSSRTNGLPLELQPPSNRRQTRAKAATVFNVKRTNGPARRMNTSDSLATPNRSKRNHNLGKHAPSAASASSLPKTPYRSPAQPRAATSPSSRYPHRQRSNTDGDHSTPRSVRRTRNSRVKSSGKPAESPQRREGEGETKDSPISENEAGSSDIDGQKDSENEDAFESEIDEADEVDDNRSIPLSPFRDDLEVNPLLPLPKLKLLLRAPRLPILHPQHIPAPQKYSSLSQWLDRTGIALDEEDRHLTQEEAKEEASIRSRILAAAQPSGILSEDRCSMFQPEALEEPPLQYGHWDHVVAHGLYLRKLIDKEQKQHRLVAKRLANEALEEYKKRLWEKHEKYYQSQHRKTVEEIEQEELALTTVRYKQLMNDLDQSWNLVKAEVHKIRLERWEEEQKARGKQVMNEMFNHSSMILNQQRARISPDDLSDEDFEQTSDDEFDEVDTDGPPRDEDDEDALEIPDDEQDLSQEALREKYRNALEVDLEEAASQSEVGEPDPALSDIGNGGTARSMTDHISPDYGTSGDDQEKRKRSRSEDVDHMEEMTPSDYLTEGIDPSHVELEEVDDVLLESDDQGSDMEDSEELSESEEENGSANDTGSDESDDDDLGLLGFLPRAELKKLEVPKQEKSFIDEHLALQNSDAEKSDQMVIDHTSTLDSGPEAPRVDRPGPVETNSSNGLLSEVSDFNPIVTSPSASFVDEKAKSSVERQDISEQLSLNTTPEPVSPMLPSRINIPHLLRGTLREYQHDGLDWLAKLYATKTNGILADEMGLGKTIQTIALLAHLAVDKGVWGPHLVVVPTSVMLNWEMEFKKWCPGFKVLSYYGDIEERKRKRKGWLNDDFINVCITSYNLVLSDASAFKKRAWHYLILDEAHNIKNFQSLRWQTLLTFRTHSRLLLTGTPLQNNLIELWSLLYFLMPSKINGDGGFTELANFTTALHRPAAQILDQGIEQLNKEDQAQVAKFHEVLRPFLLRRLKADVEKQMPSKTEHVVYCRLSKRQRQLYDGFMGRADTRATLSSGNYLSIMNCLMSLRKVCNHPDLFETRQIVTSFAMSRSVAAEFEIKDLLVRRRLLEKGNEETVNIGFLNLKTTLAECSTTIRSRQPIITRKTRHLENLIELETRRLTSAPREDGSSVSTVVSNITHNNDKSYLDHLQQCLNLTTRRLQQKSVYGTRLIRHLDLKLYDRFGARSPPKPISSPEWYLNTSNILFEMVPTLEERAQSFHPLIGKFACVTPAAIAEDLTTLALSSKGVEKLRASPNLLEKDAFHESRVRLSIAFPDKRLLQYDCGKLQRLDKLLRQLVAGGHRALIFTQMTKVLDILEQFLNIHGYRYLRLDGATKIEQRQLLTERFQSDPKIPVFILSSRSGGLGLNLTGADTVIFYDMDWNPAMDKQCQDRAHRIGQTRDVHIYKFVSEYTIEANILRKSNQKRLLDDVIIQKGDFTTDYFNKISYKDALDGMELALEEDTEATAAMDRVLGNVGNQGLRKVLASVEDQEDSAAAQVAQKELVHDVEADDADFKDTEPKGDESIPTETTGIAHPIQETLDSQAITNSPMLIWDDERPHVDEFMVKHMDWELKDIPVAPPLGATKKKKKKPWEPQARRRR